MDFTNSIINYRRYLKRKVFSPNTIKNYLNMLQHYIVWLNVPLEQVDHNKISEYIDHMLEKNCKPKTINCHLAGISGFYQYLHFEEDVEISNPVRSNHSLRMPKPLPGYIKDDDIKTFFDAIKNCRDHAMFKIMLRCGLRVEEVANLTLDCLDFKYKKIIVKCGKGGKGRVVCISKDARLVVTEYLNSRKESSEKRIFLVEKGTYKGRALSVRGIQKRMEYYAKKTNLKISCHSLRHTMATQLLNAEAQLSSIQDLLGHNWASTTEKYARISNKKVENDYFNAMEYIMKRQKKYLKKNKLVHRPTNIKKLDIRKEATL